MKFTKEQQEILSESISKWEVIKAIRIQKMKKSPGPDGILSEYYQQCEGTIVDPLYDLISHIFQGNHIPEIWKQSIPVLIPKKGKNPEEIQNFHY